MTGPIDQRGSGAPDEPISTPPADVPPADAPRESGSFEGADDATMRTELDAPVPPEAPAQFATEPERVEVPGQLEAPPKPETPAQFATEPEAPEAPGPPATEPEAPAVAWAPPPSAAVPTSTGWVVPAAAPRRSRTRGCVIGCVIVAAILGVLAVVGLVAVIFLGGQIQSILRGTVQFGTGGDACSVTARAESFPTGADLHFVAWLARDVTAGETITIVETYPDGTADPVSQPVDAAASCLYGNIASGPASGHYTLEVRVGTESLAKGAFDATP